LRDVIRFKGHPNIKATHSTTIEITKESWLTPKGDCIIGISADKACIDLSSELKESIRKASKLKLTIVVGDKSFQFFAHGAQGLELSDKTSIVIRKSNFVSSRTLAIRSEAAASDVPRDIIECLKKGEAGMLVIEALEDPNYLP